MSLKYSHLEGLEWDEEKQHCYTILRQFFLDNFDIELTDYACPTEWWTSDMDLYSRLAPAEGFAVIHDHPRDWRPGDVILMAIQSSTGNHAAVLLDNGRILHHLVGQRSCVTPYAGMFRNTTVGVYRHKDVPLQKPAEELVNVRDLLPPHARRRLEDLEAAGLSLADVSGPRGDT